MIAESKTYSGVVLGDNPVSASIRPSPAGLEVVSDATRRLLRYEKLLITVGGADRKLIYISHEAEPHLTLYVRDRSILSDYHIADHPVLRDQLSRVRQTNLNNQRLTLGTLLVFVASLFTVWYFWGYVTLFIAQSVPFKWERKLGNAMFGVVRGEKSMLEGDEISRLIKQVAAPLVAVVEKEGFQVELHVSESSDLNAFALPGGIVVVNSGLILKAAAPEEVLGVLGHEFAHVTRRHVLQSVVTIFGVSTVVDFILGDIFGTVTAVTQGADLLLRQSFSRSYEREADLVGIGYLEAAQINPSGLLTFFEKLKQELENRPEAELGKKLSFLSTHPATDERIESIRRELKGAEYQPVSSDDFRQLQELLKNRLATAAKDK